MDPEASTERSGASTSASSRVLLPRELRGLFAEDHGQHFAVITAPVPCTVCGTAFATRDEQCAHYRTEAHVLKLRERFSKFWGHAYSAPVLDEEYGAPEYRELVVDLDAQSECSSSESGDDVEGSDAAAHATDATPAPEQTMSQRIHDAVGRAVEQAWREERRERHAQHHHHTEEAAAAADTATAPAEPAQEDSNDTEITAATVNTVTTATTAASKRRYGQAKPQVVQFFRCSTCNQDFTKESAFIVHQQTKKHARLLAMRENEEKRAGTEEEVR